MKCLVLLLFLIRFARCNIAIYDSSSDQTVEKIQSVNSDFGPIFISEKKSYLFQAIPLNACMPIIEPPNKNYSFVVLIKRGLCTFTEKVLAAQQAGFEGAIIYNDLGDNIFPMQGNDNVVNIPSIMVGQNDGFKLSELYSYQKQKYNYFLVVYSYHFNPELYIMAFLAFVTAGFVIVGIGFAIRICRDIMKRRANRLRKCHLKKIPIKKFKKGEDRYETCAICLEDYEDGDKLRVLFCSHAYHTSCIDPWLLKQKRNCPICKARIRIPGVHDNDSQSSSEQVVHTPHTNAVPHIQSDDDDVITNGTQGSINNETNSLNGSVIIDLTNGNNLTLDETTPLIQPSNNGKDNKGFQYSSVNPTQVLPDVKFPKSPMDKASESSSKSSRNRTRPAINNYSNDIIIHAPSDTSGNNSSSTTINASNNKVVPSTASSAPANILIDKEEKNKQSPDLRKDNKHNNDNNDDDDDATLLV